ncbi:MAG: sulfatase-like hydrolase/transferase [Deltaproteobacteria bacterium]|nr:sulfatase-like hydrolase/transferase [Deltaproteobacteria bacterium]
MIVLVVVADSLKGEAPGFAGGGAATPFLDGLAAEGAVFDNYCASGAWTIPSVMSMLTGTWPHRLGLCRWRHPFPAHRATLLTAFAAAGFETRCFHPYPQWGFLTLPGKTRVENSQDVAAVESALRAPRGHDRFVFLLHWWTHLPYVNRELARGAWHAACDLSLDSLAKYPGRFAAMLERRYFDAVSYFSEQVLPRYVNAAASGGDDVLVAVTGDHGETWGRSLPSGRNVELIYDLHGRWITDETIRVPLVLHGRGADGAIPARRIDGMAAGVDFAPTVADLAGIPWPGPAPAETGSGVAERLFAPEDDAGVSLAACVREGAVTPRREVMTVSSHNTHEPKNLPRKRTQYVAHLRAARRHGMVHLGRRRAGTNGDAARGPTGAGRRAGRRGFLAARSASPKRRGFRAARRRGYGGDAARRRAGGDAGAAFAGLPD